MRHFVLLLAIAFSAGEAAFNASRTYNDEEINSFVQSIQKQYPDRVEVSTIGKTYEGRNILLVKIQDSEQSKPIILIDAGIQARSWVTVSSALYMIDKLATNSPDDKTVQQMLDSFDFYIIPNMNPDGYEFTFNDSNPDNKYWTKNRSNARGGKCVGVYLDANFDVGWSSDQSDKNNDTDPCNEFYRGPEPFSEAETQAFKRVVDEKNNFFNKQIKVYVSLRTFGQRVLTPFSYKLDLPKDFSAQYFAANKMSHAMGKISSANALGGCTYATYSGFYPLAFGTSTDWAYETGGIQYTYQFELPLPRTCVYKVPDIKYCYQPMMSPMFGEFVYSGISTMSKQVKKDLQSKNSHCYARPPSEY